jgi:hypothetical protein
VFWAEIDGINRREIPAYTSKTISLQKVWLQVREEIVV